MKIKKKKKWHKNILINLLVQTIPVVFGVFLAMYISENEQDKKEKRYAINLLERAKKQIIKDSVVSRKLYEGHMAFSEKIKSHLNDSLSIIDLISKEKGFKMSPTRDNYLQMLSYKIENLSINKSYEIYELLELIKGKEKYEETIQEIFYNSITSNSKKNKLILASLISDYAYLEKQLLEAQKKLLK